MNFDVLIVREKAGFLWGEEGIDDVRLTIGISDNDNPEHIGLARDAEFILKAKELFRQQESPKWMHMDRY